MWDKHPVPAGPFVLEQLGGAGSQTVKCPSDALWDFRAFPAKGRQVRGEITHPFLIKEGGNLPSNTLCSTNTPGVKPAIVLNTQRDHFLELFHRNPRNCNTSKPETRNPCCQFKSLLITPLGSSTPLLGAGIIFTLVITRKYRREF